ncbi:shikimate dehydrogenase [Desulfonatronum thioautotrophicum]|uniref:shikimate dehydrogenase n=1 Tax=Desulfonatronum thioautotrophicum TaxID=617001 RepID=UPI00069B4CC2|nr:shikimate dehydrogenase [Desulfonatronum thioautotrophicum]
MNPESTVFIPEQLYGIIGHPLGHSMSPLVHNWGFQHCALLAAYFRWPTPPERLPEFVTAVRCLPIAGVSVTIPHKRTIMPFLDGMTTDARRVGAVNTLMWQEGALWGDNTDVQGFLAPLLGVSESLNSALVLGVGGASRAAVIGLQQLGVASLLVCGRNPDATRTLADQLGCGWLDWKQRHQWSGDLLVNATPLGMAGSFAQQSPWPGKLTGIGIAYDLVYNPQDTGFLRQAADSGVRTIGGLEMFIAQAQGQFRLWTKKELPADSLRELLSAVLNAP